MASKLSIFFAELKRRNLTRFVFGCLAGTLVSAACLSTDADWPLVVVRDSAGIRIVESTPAVSGGGERWGVSKEAALDLSLVASGPEYEFYNVVGALRLTGGRIAVANAGTGEIRFFDQNGRFLRSAGRAGEGPGEFSALASLHRMEGDSLFAFDNRQRRVSLFSPEGQLLRTISLAEGPGIPYDDAQPFSDGSILARTFYSPAMFEQGPRLGLRRDPAFYVGYSPQGEFLDTVAVLPGKDLYLSEDGRLPPLFGRIDVYTVGANRWYAASSSSDAFEIGVYTPDGQLVQLIRKMVSSPSVSEADLQEVEAALFERFRDPQVKQWWMEVFDEIPVPERKPPFCRFVIDSGGNLWVAEFADLRWEDDPEVWTVFDTDGRMLGTAKVPARFRVFDIGSDFLLGVHRDESNVEHVQQYELVKRQ